MQSKKEHTGEDADYGAAPGKHQFVFLSKASLNYHSKKMRDSHLQLEKKMGSEDNFICFYVGIKTGG